MSQEFTIGVEEEYQIIDPQTRQLCGQAAQIIPIAKPMLRQSLVQPEIHCSQIEVATPVCRTLAEVRAALVRSRSSIMVAAAQDGKTIGSGGTHPFSNWHEQQITLKARYQWMAECRQSKALRYFCQAVSIPYSLRIIYVVRLKPDNSTYNFLKNPNLSRKNLGV